MWNPAHRVMTNIVKSKHFNQQFISKIGHSKTKNSFFENIKTTLMMVGQFAVSGATCLALTKGLEFGAKILDRNQPTNLVANPDFGINEAGEPTTGLRPWYPVSLKAEYKLRLP